MSTVLGSYSGVTATARDDGTVSLDFTSDTPGPFIVLNAIQWRRLLLLAQSLPRPR